MSGCKSVEMQSATEQRYSGEWLSARRAQALSTPLKTLPAERASSG